MSTVVKLSPATAQAMVQSGKGMFVDVRSISEALEEQVPKSVFLPFDLVSKERLQDLGIEGKTPIIVCRSGRRAGQAAEALAQTMDSVAVLDGGIVRWKADGLAVNEGHKALPLDRQVLIAAGSMMLLFMLLGLLVSPLFFAIALFMSCGMIFAGITGACGMARILLMMPWNKAPMCGGMCAVKKQA